MRISLDLGRTSTGLENLRVPGTNNAADSSKEKKRRGLFGDNPAHVLEIGYESVENLDSQTLEFFPIVGPQIYILKETESRAKSVQSLRKGIDGEETWNSTLRLDPFFTVFQMEMVGLQRA
ncbi:hypothetical protein EVAR_87071_1 [Eumeta japonica]|uniref:Uncharacterized protein n=1 Tax=Eumeta variegata TaxID=151549 RepID=A0A4C1VQI2_EUMVA|nr:hypothetical protein EVAR_87071_1 [Eumeta japonica]